MEDHMAVDTTLWLIIAASVAFVWLGCIMTAGDGKSGSIARDRFRH
jgi:hypothetical protein